MNPDRLRLLLTLLSFVLLAGGLTACNTGSSAATAVPNAEVTYAYQTVEARLTQSFAQIPSPTATLSPSPTFLPDPTTPVSTPTAPGVSSTPTLSAEEPCDRAAPGYPRIDVEIDDDTLMQPGERFTKIWRLVNSGVCTWTREYKAVWFFGARLGEILAVPLSTVVAPGESVDIVVDMVAPQTPGTYQSNWKLQNEEGVMFGIGPEGNSPFWVRIVVEQPPTPTPSPTTPAPPTETPTLTPTVTETPTATPIVVVSGEIVMQIGDSVDFDAGVVNPESGADLVYQEDAIGTNWLAPGNGALLGIYGAGEPTRQICMAANMSSAPIAVGSLSPGAFLCYRTNEDLPGWLKLIGLGDNEDINLAFLTWQSDNP
jgi:hypothetical protein